MDLVALACEDDKAKANSPFHDSKIWILGFLNFRTRPWNCKKVSTGYVYAPEDSIGIASDRVWIPRSISTRYKFGAKNKTTKLSPQLLSHCVSGADPG